MAGARWGHIHWLAVSLRVDVGRDDALARRRLAVCSPEQQCTRR